MKTNIILLWLVIIFIQKSIQEESLNSIILAFRSSDYIKCHQQKSLEFKLIPSPIEKLKTENITILLDSLEEKSGKSYNLTCFLYTFESLSCNLTKLPDGKYSINKVSSQNYKYKLDIPSVTEVRIGYQCNTHILAVRSILFKDAPVKVKTSSEDCKAELFIKKKDSETYYPFTCSQTDKIDYDCQIPSTYHIDTNDVFIYKRSYCGMISLSSTNASKIYDFSLVGEKYINLNEKKTHIFKITTTYQGEVNKENNTYSLPLLYINERKQDYIYFNSCTQIVNTSPYQYNCPIIIDDGDNNHKEGLYILYSQGFPFSSKYWLTLYRPTILTTSFSLGSSFIKEPNKIQIQFIPSEGTITNDISDHPENAVRGIKIESDTMKVTLNNKCINVVENNILLVECSITSKDYSTIYLYYKNQTENLVLIDTFNLDGLGKSSFSLLLNVNLIVLLSLVLSIL